MKPFGIRSRILLAALLPVALLAAVLSGVFIVDRVNDLDVTHRQRAEALARQVASASEYGLFSGNREALQNLVRTALREADVRSATIFDAGGRVLARAGNAGYGKLGSLSGTRSETADPAAHVLLLTQPIIGSRLALNDLYNGAAPSRPLRLGEVVLELSTASVQQRRHELMLTGILTTLGSLLFGGLLAVRLARGVIGPIVEVGKVVERIGKGELSARVAVDGNSSLQRLEQGVNQMAARIESGQEELQRRIIEATAELRIKKEEAELATLAKSRFLASASHDLRQPMHALVMFMGRLVHLPHSDEARHLIGRIDASVHALQHLLDALLDISRLEAGVLRARPRHFPVRDLFSQLSGDLNPVAEERGLKLKLRPSELWLTTDPILLHRILLNLVSNALRYTRRGGVLVACRRRGVNVRIEVWDSGIGIPPESQAEIFKEFVQLANPERDRNQGLGLGLAIVERTARLLDHPLTMNSLPGVGSRFAIEVPIAPPGVATPAAATPSPQGQFEGLRVLVIDDDALARQGLTVLLESWGCRVSAAEDAEQALTLACGENQAELIACDYRLRHGQNGIGALALLRARGGLSAPAFLISGDTDPGLMKSAADAGIPLLHKPVQPARLRALMHRLVLDKSAEATT
ncbi:signal transduction histidine-protein kinase BarA [mine drainage metagenome]|uniref:histidine kinase n=1 Tax=mine drainage metagenome TaxID=410659 RepID=A0A1J5RU80_9ZZZZ